MNRFSYAVSILAAGLVLAELGARWIFPLPEVANFERSRYTRFFSPELMRQTSLSNASFVYPSDPDGAASLHELNAYGFRDREWAVEADPAVARIAFVGDSYVEGFLASKDATIPAAFDARAREKGVAPIETLNFGIGALGPGGYALVISDAVPLFDPDIVIVVLYANDIWTEPFASQFRPSADVVETPPGSRIVSVLKRWRNGESVARRWRSKPVDFFAPVPHSANPWSSPGFASGGGRHVSPKLAAAMSAGRFNPLVIGEVEEYAAMLTKRPYMENFLSGAKQFVTAHSAKLRVAYLPGRNQVTDAYLAYHAEYSLSPPPPSLTGAQFQRHAKALAQQCRRLGIPFLDLTPVVRSHEERGVRLYWKYDSHMSEAGYALVGRELFDWIEPELERD